MRLSVLERMRRRHRRSLAPYYSAFRAGGNLPHVRGASIRTAATPSRGATAKQRELAVIGGTLKPFLACLSFFPRILRSSSARGTAPVDRTSHEDGTAQRRLK